MRFLFCIQCRHFNCVSGYANEVGEAFRSIIGARWVTVTYGIATAYVIADTADKTKKMHDVSGKYNISMCSG